MADLRRRVTTASKYIPFAQLGGSTKYGFASSVLGNPISPEEEKKKLALVARTALEVWDKGPSSSPTVEILRQHFLLHSQRLLGYVAKCLSDSALELNSS